MTTIAHDARIAGAQRTYPPRAAVVSWIFFDWAAQPYFTLITTFVFAPYFATSIAPDPATGLGMRYTEAKFLAAMRTGKKPEGVAVMPPMPVDVYVNMKDEDLKAIYAYLKTIKPIRNAVRAGLTPPAPAKK